MYFVYRDGTYIDASGQSFRDFMKGELPALPGEKPRLKDWEDHMTTAFPEVRLKQYLEMQCRWWPMGKFVRFACFLGSSDDQALAEAEAYIADWSIDEMEALRNAVPKTALQTPFRDGILQEVATIFLRLPRRIASSRSSGSFWK